MYKTLKKGEDELYHGTCPACGLETCVDSDLTVLAHCGHFVRRWRVQADGRVRVEFLASSSPARS